MDYAMFPGSETLDLTNTPLSIQQVDIEVVATAAQVNYVGKGGNLYQSGYEYHGSSLVVSKLLGATYLWDKVSRAV